YDFEGTLLIRNIDKESIYDLNLSLEKDLADVITFPDQQNPFKIKIDHLPPNKSLQGKLYKRIPYRDSGSNVVEATKLLPESFKSPDIVLRFRNYNKKKFSQKVEVITQGMAMR